MPGRQYNSTTYSFTFNGKRDDKDDAYGWQDCGMVEYDRRRAQFISVNPLSKKYTWFTPYQYSDNMPLRYIDLDGAEPFDPVGFAKFIASVFVDALKSGNDFKNNIKQYTAVQNNNYGKIGLKKGVNAVSAQIQSFKLACPIGKYFVYISGIFSSNE